MSAPQLIDDGYNFDGVIPGRAGGLPELRFTYRPAVPLRILKHSRATKGGKEEVELAEHVKLIVEHVSGWNVIERGGASIPVSAEAAAKVPWPYLIGMVNHVTGYGGKVEDVEGN